MLATLSSHIYKTAESGDYLVYTVDPDTTNEELTKILKSLENEERKDQDSRLILEWGLSQSTLEDVFLRITNDAGYSGGRNTNQTTED